MAKTKGIAVTAQTLAAIEAFALETAAVRTEIAPFFSGQRYAKGEQVIRQDDDDRSVCFVLSGTVRVTYYPFNGKKVAFRDLTAGAMFGELPALDGGRRSAQVVAQNNILVAWLPRDHFLMLLKKLPGFSAYVMQRLVKLVRLLSERVIEIGSLGVTNRIHAELLRLARAATVEGNRAIITPSPNRDDFANRISTVRYAVSKEINLLMRKGVLEKQRGALVVGDLKALEAMVDQPSMS
jgi:CRP/FNR family transcriptional regulator, cyclic AMP receptor protein